MIAISAPSPIRGPSLVIRVYPLLRSLNCSGANANKARIASLLAKRDNAIRRLWGLSIRPKVIKLSMYGWIALHLVMVVLILRCSMSEIIRPR